MHLCTIFVPRNPAMIDKIPKTQSDSGPSGSSSRHALSQLNERV